MVATGTGSGKTESFLIPDPPRCLSEQAAGGVLGPGVRALLLYPMNALANDQVKRLRGLLATAPHITFGRYVGDTPETRRALEAYQVENPGSSGCRTNCLSREEMQASRRTCCSRTTRCSSTSCSDLLTSPIRRPDRHLALHSAGRGARLRRRQGAELGMFSGDA